MSKLINVFINTIIVICITICSCDTDCNWTSSSISLEQSSQCINSPLLSELKQIKVLDIGNSYSSNYTDYLPEIFTQIHESDSKLVSLYVAERGGASFKSWVDIYNDNGSTYSIKKVLGSTLEPSIVSDGLEQDGSLFRHCLQSHIWDVIIIHQFSGYSTHYEDWSSDKDSGYLDELIEIIKNNQPNALIGFLLVHSYSDTYNGNIEQSSYIRWTKIAEAIRKLKENYDVDIVIPCGTAIENIRLSSYNNVHDLTCDGTHLSEGLAKYTAACCYFETLFSQITKRSILSTKFKYTKFWESQFCVNVNKCSAELAQIAAVTATYDWYTCYNPENISVLSFK